MELTIISKNNMDILTRTSVTPGEMVRFLKEGALFRGFGDVLRAVYPGEDLARRLADALTEDTGEPRDSVLRKVRNWLKGKNIPRDREILFQICFALGLDEAQADRVLGNASEMAIHYRNPRELVYAFALRTGMDYKSAVALLQEVEQTYPEVFAGSPSAQTRYGNSAKCGASAQSDDPIRTENRAEKGRKAGRQADRDGNAAFWGDPVYTSDIETGIAGGVYLRESEIMYTNQVREAFSGVETMDELFAFFGRYGGELRKLHETAYRKFTKLLDYLMHPEDEAGAEEKYSLEEIVQTYMRMCVPMAKVLDDFDAIQKYMKKNWPSATSLSRMRSRKEEVSRKALLLLYLVTEEFDETPKDHEEYAWMEDEEEEPDTLLEIRIQKINLFLKDCGMNLLDPGNPFDLLLMYSMKTGEEEYADEKMAELLRYLYGNIDEDAEDA